MTKNSTTILKDYKTQEEREEEEANEIQNDFADVFNKLGNSKIEAPQKTVDFVLNFSKAYKTFPTKDGNI